MGVRNGVFSPEGDHGIVQTAAILLLAGCAMALIRTMSATGEGAHIEQKEWIIYGCDGRNLDRIAGN